MNKDYRNEDEMIEDAIIEDEDQLTNCCGVPFILESDMCSDCKEHASAEVAVKIGCNEDRGDVTACVTYDRLTSEVQDVQYSFEFD